MTSNNDELIRNAILETLHNAYREPKGRLKHPSQSVIYHEVRSITNCEREDVIRELTYLLAHKLVKVEKTKVPASSYGKYKTPSSTYEHYHLSVDGIDWFENPSKHQNQRNHAGTVISISGSPIHAPITVGNNNNIVSSYNINNDVEEVLHLITSNNQITQEEKSNLTALVKNELPSLLSTPDLTKTKTFSDKLKSFGQQWLIPICTQLVATYFQHSLGINQ